MRLRLYIDEDAMSRALANGLRINGADVLTVLDEAMTGREDAEQRAYATQLARALYTYNVGHFSQLHYEYLALGKTHAGIVVAQNSRVPIGEQIRRLLRLIETKSAEEMCNTLHFL